MRTQEQPPKSICILRLSALGDATHVLPVIRTIQDQWPDTHISWIIGVLEHKLIGQLDGVEFIVFDKRAGWPAIRKLRRDLRGRSFDVLLQMQVAARANLLSKLVKASVRIGWDKSRSRDFHHYFVNRTVAAVPFQHQVQGFLEFPRALGLVTGQPRWELPVSEAARSWLKNQIDTTLPTLVISPCSSHVLRNWDASRYATVADFAVDELGMQLVISGGPAQIERETSALIEKQMNQACINLAGKDTLEQSKALLDHADLVISPDSGPAHIASALGTPVMGLYAATWSKRSGPYNSLDLCIDQFAQAAGDYRNSTPEALRWGTKIEVPGVMDLIQSETVITALKQWWQSHQAPT